MADDRAELEGYGLALLPQRETAFAEVESARIVDRFRVSRRSELLVVKLVIGYERGHRHGRSLLVTLMDGATRSVLMVRGEYLARLADGLERTSRELAFELEG